mmetsp:Transcript_3756/g.12239  ORF Transcript_3756/g.12239 Transcript_3756/m.12239 type:complete len:218 (-) Transcript_3756:1365-2018(-)
MPPRRRRGPSPAVRRPPPPPRRSTRGPVSRQPRELTRSRPTSPRGSPRSRSSHSTPASCSHDRRHVPDLASRDAFLPHFIATRRKGFEGQDRILVTPRLEDRGCDVVVVVVLREAVHGGDGGVYAAVRGDDIRVDGVGERADGGSLTGPRVAGDGGERLWFQVAGGFLAKGVRRDGGDGRVYLQPRAGGGLPRVQGRVDSALDDDGPRRLQLRRSAS